MQSGTAVFCCLLGGDFFEKNETEIETWHLRVVFDKEKKDDWEK